MITKESTYLKSVAEIETILSKIERGETDIDDLPAAIKRASLLLQECKEKLHNTEKEIDKIMKSEE